MSCVVCTLRPAQVCLLPCAHVAWCNDCYDTHTAMSSCPVCRCHVRKTLQIYFPGQEKQTQNKYLKKQLFERLFVRATRGEALPKPVTAAPPAAREEEVQVEPAQASGILALADAAQADIEKMKEIENIETWICEDLDEMNIVDAMDRSGKEAH